MSAIGDCCNPCPQPVPTNIPGPPGSNGSDGTNGVNAFSTIALFQGVGFVVPAVGASATVFLTDTGEWMAVGQTVYVQSAGFYVVTAAASTSVNGVSVQLQNTGFTGNAPPGSVISSGQQISPGGIQGTSSFTLTTAPFTVPNPNSTIPTPGAQATITCASTAWMIPGMMVFVQGGGYLYVISVNATNGTAVLQNIGNAGTTAGAVVPTGSQVGPAGVQGSLPLPQPQGFFSNSLSTNLTNGLVNVGSAKVTLPAAGTWLLQARICLLITFTSGGIGSNSLQVTAQLESQAGGVGGFSAIPTSVTSPNSPCGSGSGSVMGLTFTLPPSIYTTATIGDVIALFQAYVGLSGGSGTFTAEVVEASVTATCLNLTT